MMDKSNLLALDFGDARIGVAIASSQARLPAPLMTLKNDAELWIKLPALVADNRVGTVVVGLPRGLDGQSTAQTAKAEAFMTTLRSHIDAPVIAQDEAATSLKAKEELLARGKPYEKGAVDALAATYILEDYLRELKYAEPR